VQGFRCISADFGSLIDDPVWIQSNLAARAVNESYTGLGDLRMAQGEDTRFVSIALARGGRQYPLINSADRHVFQVCRAATIHAFRESAHNG
jgi:hypothetical protein